ncbi:MAG: serine/threonine protein kinase, partial [Myxococcales bacterium]|nr:serine/threonine protein kinase [Myxococcales bacterium]
MTSSVTNDETPTRAEPSSSSLESGGSSTAPAGPAGEGPARGDQVGRYIIVDVIGTGGMGQVFSAYDPELDRKIALKLLRIKARRSDRRAGERLVREAQALAKLAHPNVVTVFDAGAHGDQVFVAMEHIQGITLKAWLRERERSWQEVVDVMREVGRGLAAAHAAGLVHRDLKPDNVMLGRDGRARVLDFGLARRFGDDSVDEELAFDAQGEPVGLERSGSGPDVALTATGMVLGTPRFMAPEQFSGGHIDARSDQFAFCVVLYRALFGGPPFAGEDYRSLGRAVLRGERVTPPRVRGLPRSVRQAVERGLSVSKDDRFPSMEPLLEVLDRARGSRRRRAAQVGLLGAAGMLGLATLAWSSPEDAPCEGLEGVGEAWDEARAGAVRAAFEATDAAFAADAAARVGPALDDYARQWHEARVDACEATLVRRSQSESLMDRRVACLESRRQRLAALTELLATADAEVVQRAVDAVGQLPTLSRCSDAAALLADVAPPDD